MVAVLSGCYLFWWRIEFCRWWIFISCTSSQFGRVLCTKVPIRLCTSQDTVSSDAEEVQQLASSTCCCSACCSCGTAIVVLLVYDIHSYSCSSSSSRTHTGPCACSSSCARPFTHLHHHHLL